MRCTPDRPVGAVGQNGRILDGNVDLVVKPVRYPAPDLIRRGPPRIKHHVEGVINVIRLAFLPQALLKLRMATGGLGQSSISRPSQATSTARRTSAAAC